MKGSHVDFRQGHVVVHGLKGHGVVQKALVPHARQLLEGLKKSGANTARTVKQGVWKKVKIEGKWYWREVISFRSRAT